MTSATPTLMDPFELAARPRLPSLAGSEQPTEWFERGDLPSSIAHAALVIESRESPQWTPEPIDRRWRARGWTDD